MRFSRAFLAALIAAFVTFTAPLCAHHSTDAGASGLAGLAPSADLLQPGAIRLSWSLSSVFYAELKDEQLRAEVEAQGGLAEQLAQDYALAQTLELGVGLLPWLQASLSGGTLRTEHLREGHLHGNGSYGQHDYGSPQGATDTGIGLKLGHSFGPGRASLSLGATLPTGRDDVLNDSISVDATANTATGQVKSSPKIRYLGLGSQPGGGAGEFNLALAWTQDLGSTWTVDLGAQALLTQAYKTYKAGDQHSVGLALRWRYSQADHARSSLGLGLGFSHAEMSNSNGVSSQESGSWALQLGPQWAQAFGEHVLVQLSGSLPVAQAVNGLQQKPVARASGGLSLLF